MISRRSQLAICTALVAGVAISAFAVEYNEWRLVARLEGDMLHVAAPNFSFLKGKPMEHLKDGGSVAFIAQLTVSTSPNYLIADARSAARFAISYDIWEEKLSVTRITNPPEQRITNPPEQRRTMSHLSASDAEKWCLDGLVINRSDLPADQPFYLQLDLRAEDPRDLSAVLGESGISISKWAEMLARPVRDKQSHWLLQTGPLRLDDLRKGMHG